MRKLFAMQIKVTPTSAKIAAHIPPIPKKLKTTTATLRPNARIMFSTAIRFVFRLICSASGIAESSSRVSTMSAASTAASLPMAPIAMPTSAMLRAGARCFETRVGWTLAKAKDTPLAIRDLEGADGAV